jgi:hypothetical protein
MHRGNNRPLAGQLVTRDLKARPHRQDTGLSKLRQMLSNRSIDRAGCQGGRFLHSRILPNLHVAFIAAIRLGLSDGRAPVSIRWPGKDTIPWARVARSGAILLYQARLQQ